mmetsp:Transcript_21400/g.61036  ORF Transcript_21400/g.61036 Transcript_21400/m.61036 type:complete len:200 (-) Transcript_21400:184-783(-)
MHNAKVPEQTQEPGKQALDERGVCRRAEQKCCTRRQRGNESGSNGPHKIGGCCLRDTNVADDARLRQVVAAKVFVPSVPADAGGTFKALALHPKAATDGGHDTRQQRRPAGQRSCGVTAAQQWPTGSLVTGEVQTVCPMAMPAHMQLSARGDRRLSDLLVLPRLAVPRRQDRRHVCGHDVNTFGYPVLRVVPAEGAVAA